MKLFLASEAKNPTTLAALTNIIGGNWSGKKVTYIPTAANGEQPHRDWRESETWQLIQSLGANLTILELEKTMSTELPHLLADTEVIWFAGGMPGYLLYWIRRVKLDIFLPQLLSKGCLYVGSSAGSMIASRTQSVSEWYIGEEEPGANLLPGLGLVDFEIYPHYQPVLLPEIKQHWHKGTLYLIKDGEAIIWDDNQLHFVGSPQVLTL